MIAMIFCGHVGLELHRAAPAESAPNSSAAGITPSGLFFASSATAMPVKPKPDGELVEEPVVARP